ncbi:MAG: chemotaxis response regulator protein-glutamate methylesterase [Acidobacteria bacterium]|nr:chemotaxis response regulator protein-glutamate methylesterase [Acidobacteriota bacterium]
MDSEQQKIKVLVTDDSALMRKLISDMISTDPEIEVVATAMDGLLALKKIELFQPDIITLDIMMPNMDGLTALQHIVNRFGLPVIIVSSLSKPGAEITIKALTLGAVDFVTKPQNILPEQVGNIAGELISKIKTIFNHKPRVKTIKLSKLEEKIIEKPSLGSLSKILPVKEILEENTKIICIGISTGGPEALSFLLSKIPAKLAASLLIVQHMPEGFTGQLAQRLDRYCEMPVKEASNGDLIIPGRVLIAPGGRHMYVKKRVLALTVVVTEGTPVSGHCPSVDVLFASIATECGSKAIGLIMTGMGEDGVAGLGQIKQAGGLTLAQDEASSVVFGMPRVALARGYVDEVLSLEQLPNYLIEKVGLL